METVARRCRIVVLALALLLAVAGGAAALAVADGPPCRGAPLGPAGPFGIPPTGAGPALDQLRAEVRARWRRLLAPLQGGGPTGACPAPPMHAPADLAC